MQSLSAQLAAEARRWNAHLQSCADVRLFMGGRPPCRPTYYFQFQHEGEKWDGSEAVPPMKKSAESRYSVDLDTASAKELDRPL
jgi:hypothetical protein